MSPYPEHKNELSAKIGNSVIKNSKCEKLLGILVDCDLNFDLQLKAILAKVSKKLNALRRVATYMTIEKRRIVMKAFIQSQFSYCLLVWMMHSRSFNNRINRLHERAIRTVYSDYHTDFDDLLKLDKSVTIHMKNVHFLATEIFKFLKGLSPKIIN